MSIVLLRHAQSTFNAYGDNSRDCGLSQAGREQAKASIFGSVDLVLCSTMKRARQTLDESRLAYRVVMFTPLLRERLASGESDYYSGEAVSPESDEDFEKRMNLVKQMIIETSKAYKTIAMISHSGVITAITGQKDIPNCGRINLTVEATSTAEAATSTAEASTSTAEASTSTEVAVEPTSSSEPLVIEL